MEELSIKYTRQRDRVGDTVEKNFMSLGLKMKSTPMQVLRGELLEGVPEADLQRSPVVSIQVVLIQVEVNSSHM